MSLFRAIYTSRPFGFDEGILNNILAEARRLNLQNDITGALICRADIYLQWLEGTKEQVEKTLKRIAQDDRHNEMKVHVAESCSERRFVQWAMLHDPAVSWLWTQVEVDDGALERTTAQEIEDFFKPLYLTSSPLDVG